MSFQLREWTFHESLGQGGWGVVYRATHRFIVGDFAIKAIKGDIGGQAGVRDRFLREAAVARSLVHPNIVRTEMVFEEGTTLYLPMEMLRGATLKKVSADRNASWPVEEALDIVCQAAEAAGFAHGQGIVHRDLTMANLWLGLDGQVKVLDFGLAKITSEVTMTATGTVMGTPHYIAPEILDGSAPAGPAVDVYSLGIVLFRLLTGRFPVEVNTDSNPAVLLVALMRAHREDAIPAVRSLRPDIPPQVNLLVADCLATDPADRPADGAELALRIRTILGTVPPSADAASSKILRNLATRSSRRSVSRGWIAAAAVLGLFVGVTGGYFGAAGGLGATGATAGASVGVSSGAVAPSTPAAAGSALPDAAPDAIPSRPGEAGVEWRYSEAAGLWFTRAEVSVDQYGACLRVGMCSPTRHIGYAVATPECTFGHPAWGAHPMNCVDADGAAAFCRYVGGRVPTADEWRKEAGRKGAYPWGDEAPDCARATWRDGGPAQAGCGERIPRPVCSAARGHSAAGLCDMAGNVMEWTTSVFDGKRVVLGGAWTIDKPEKLRVDAEDRFKPDLRRPFLGIRCVSDNPKPVSP